MIDCDGKIRTTVRVDRFYLFVDLSQDVLRNFKSQVTKT